MDILRILLGAASRTKESNFERYKDSLIQSLEAIPDLKMEMQFNCDSSYIPFLKSFTPSDVYKVRLNYTNGL